MVIKQKDPGETVTLTFDFAGDLPTGVTLSGSPVMSVAVVRGTDASASGVLIGGVTKSGSLVLQQMTGGALGVRYGFTATCACSDGNTRAVGGLVDVIPAYRMS